MSKKLLTAILIVCICLPMLYLGCTESTDIVLNLEKDSITTYKSVSETKKQVKFERPSENEVSDKITSNCFEMVFDQKVTSISEQGCAEAQITIKELKVNSQSPKGVGIEFDSAAENADKLPLYAVIGKSYKISIMPDGSAKALDTNEVKDALKGAKESRLAAAYFGDEEIQKRHGVAALTGLDKEGNPVSKKNLKLGSTWTVIEDSPKGMMQTKQYEKIYKLQEIKEDNGSQIAVVTMNTIPAEGQSSAGIFAMFGDKIDADFKDTYTGRMELDLTTGKIISYNEDLQADWVAVDRSKSKKDQSAAPDILTIGYTSKVSLNIVE